MNRDMKFSEMLHGNVKVGKQQETTLRMLRMGMTELTMLGTYYLPAMRFLRSEVGYGKGMQAKREMMTKQKLVAEINRKHPALAAEHRYTEMARGGSAVNLMQIHEARKVALREWRRLNWGYYWGRVDMELMRRSMRPSRWDRPDPYAKMDLAKMICTPEQSQAKREFADKFAQYNFDWNKVPQEQEKENNE
jgi:hypothetical protein